MSDRLTPGEERHLVDHSGKLLALDPLEADDVALPVDSRGIDAVFLGRHDLELPGGSSPRICPQRLTAATPISQARFIDVVLRSRPAWFIAGSIIPGAEAALKSPGRRACDFCRPRLAVPATIKICCYSSGAMIRWETRSRSFHDLETRADRSVRER